MINVKMIPKSFHGIFCLAAFLVWTHPLPGQQLSSGGLTAGPSAVFDLSNAGQTIPGRKQASDPVACTVGEQYFNTTSNALKICTAANTWTATGGGLGDPGSNGLVKRTALNSTTAAVAGTDYQGVLTPGTGILIAGPAISADTSMMLTQATAQSGTPWKCTDAGSSGATYSCVMVPAPAVYVDKQPVIFTPGASCSGGATTLNIQSLGAKNIYKIDGATNPAANDCRAGQPMFLLYNASLNSGSGAFQMSSLLGNASFPPLPVGSAIASASAIAPTSPIHHITGTVQVTTITVPSQFAASGMGGCLRLIPDGAFTTGTTGNIAISSTAVVSRTLEFCYDNGTSKWYPSY